LIPESAFDGGKKNFLELMADPGPKSQALHGNEGQPSPQSAEDFAYAVIASTSMTNLSTA